MTPDDFREVLAFVGEHRTSKRPFDVVFAGRAASKEPAEARELVSGYAEAGVTWWLESFDWNDKLEGVREKIRQGPPRM